MVCIEVMLLASCVVFTKQLSMPNNSCSSGSCITSKYEPKSVDEQSHNVSCNLFEVNIGSKLLCMTHCTRIKGCYNSMFIKNSSLCLLCLNEDSIVPAKLETLTPYNSVPQNGQLFQREDQDDCAFGTPCLNGGTCVDGHYNYTCICPLVSTGDRCQSLESIVDCSILYKKGYTHTDVYTIQIINYTVQARCDMSNGGGWTVVQRRFNGSVSFAQNWTTYKHGFGIPEGEYWIGNNNLHRLTTAKSYELYIELIPHNGTIGTAMYDSFIVGSEQEKYRLTLGNFTGGTAGDSLSTHNDTAFSTYDQDNDSKYYSCSQVLGGYGGWWYNACDQANLNGGKYYNSPVDDDLSIEYNSFRGQVSLKASFMAIRQKNT